MATGSLKPRITDLPGLPVEGSLHVDFEPAGVEHGFEVIRNAVTGGRTNPYVIRKLLLLFDPVEKVLDPGYRFVFR